MSPVDPKRLVERKLAEPSAKVAARVMRAREIQKMRFAGEAGGVLWNASMNNKMVEKYCPLSAECKALLEKLIEKMGLSARACHRMIKLARTIADLAESADIQPSHLSEAASYRFLDKQNIFD